MKSPAETPPQGTQDIESADRGGGEEWAADRGIIPCLQGLNK